MDNERIVHDMNMSSHEGLGDLCPPRSPVPAAEMATATAGFSRREFLKKTGRVAAGAALYGTGAVSVAGKISSIYTKARWPDSDPLITLAEGAETLARGGEEYIVFMGYGQRDGRDAANELFAALGGKKVVASMRYPSQSFTCEDLAPDVAQHIRQRRIAKLNLVGVSMGTVIGLDTMRDVMLQDKRKPGRNLTATNGAQGTLPSIDYMIAYSSPSDMQDAFQGELADVIISISDRLHYSGEAAGKLLYDVADQFKNRPLYMDGLDGVAKMVVNCLLEVNNDCPPAMALSQLRILRPFNVLQQAENYRIVVNPDTQLVYVAPNSDDIVNDDRAARNYSLGFHEINVAKVTVLSSGDTNHANTKDSANVFGQWRDAQALLSQTALATSFVHLGR